jgi:hypothetical protein
MFCSQPQFNSAISLANISPFGWEPGERVMVRYSRWSTLRERVAQTQGKFTGVQQVWPKSSPRPALQFGWNHRCWTKRLRDVRRFSSVCSCANISNPTLGMLGSMQR